MKLSYLVIFFLLIPHVSSSQTLLQNTVQEKLDSLEVSEEDSLILVKLIKCLDKVELDESTDSSVDFLFLRISLDRSSISSIGITEYWYNADSSQRAIRILTNEKDVDLESYYNPVFGREKSKIFPSELLDTKRQEYENMSLLDTAEYDPEILAYGGCVKRPDMKRAKKLLKVQKTTIRHTYQLFLLKDLETGAIKVSFRLPVANPKLHIVPYYPVWDF